MRVITITGTYIDHLPKLARPVLINRISANATKYKWTIRIAGEHWN